MHEQGTREDFLDRYPEGIIGSAKALWTLHLQFCDNKGITLSVLLCLQCVRRDKAINYNEFQRSRYQQLPSRLDCAMSDSGFSEVTVASSSKVYLSRSHDNNNCGGKVGILRNKGMDLTASPRVPPSQEQAARSAWLGWGVQGSSLQFLFFFLLGFGWSPRLCQKFIFSKALQ